MKNTTFKIISFILFVVIVVEAGIFFLNTNKSKNVPVSSSVVPTKQVTPPVTLPPLVPSTLTTGETAFVFKGKVFHLETLDDPVYKYRVKIIQENGKPENIQFEERNLEIMEVTKVYPTDEGDPPSLTFHDIKLDDTIEIQLIIDQEAQSKAVNRIAAHKIVIHIL